MLLIVNCMILGSILIPPNLFAPAIFLGYLIPPLGLLDLGVAIVLVFKKRSLKSILFATMLVGLTTPFWNRTYQFSLRSDPRVERLSLLSYNTKLFRAPGVYNKFSRKLIDWVVNDSSTIKCIQEFSSNDKWPGLDITEQIKANGYFAHIYSNNLLKFGEHNPGLAIFSKYPIVSKGSLNADINEGYHGIIYADLAIDNDTFRIYNVHLQSYKIPFNDEIGMSIHQILNALRRVKFTVLDHSRDLVDLINHSEKCPHPYLIVGDFNESPYSYNYGLLSRLSNAFEKKGRGFGFTVIKPPLFLRIDNIYCSEGIYLDSFEVDTQIEFSDHYPIRTSFSLEENY